MNAPSNVIFVRGNHDEEFAAAIDIMKALFMFDNMAEVTQDSKLDYWFISYAKKTGIVIL